MGRQVTVQAGGQAEGQAGPAAQEDVEHGEDQETGEQEQEAALGERAAMGRGG